MPIIQISQIKHRRGRKQDLPKLEEGEFGYALDEGELFIGNKEDFNPIKDRDNKNTQVLTEFTRDIVGKFLDYSYKNRNPLAPSNPAYANPMDVLGNPIVRKVQDKLDDIVSVKDYGARGDGRKDNYTLGISEVRLAMDETYAIRRAALDVANVLNKTDQTGQWQPKALHFPAGVYVVTGPLFLPPNSTWIGDGKENTIIVLAAGAYGDTLNAGITDCLLFTVDNQLTVDSPGVNFNSFETTYDDPSVSNLVGIENYSYGNILPQYAPKNISIKGITFVVAKQGSTPCDIVRLIRANDVVFEDCAFRGPGVTKQDGDYKSSSDTRAVVIDNLGGPVSQGFTFTNCSFSDVDYASVVTDDVMDITFQSCNFNNLYRGISIGEHEHVVSDNKITKGTKGPQGIRVVNGLFQNILREGFSVWRGKDKDIDLTTFDYCGGHISSFNMYKNVGNNSLVQTDNIDAPYPCILFSPGTLYNASIGDTFTRNSSTGNRVSYKTDDPNIILNAQDVPYYPGLPSPAKTANLREKLEDEAVGLVKNKVNPITGFVVEKDENGEDKPTYIEYIIDPNNVSYVSSITIEYSLVQMRPDMVYRTGKINILVNPLDITNIEFDEEYTSTNINAETVTFSVEYVPEDASNPSKVRLCYINNSAFPVTMKFVEKTWKAEYKLN